VYGFRGEKGQFISREAASERLRYNPESGKLVDSLRKEVGVGALVTPESGITIKYTNADVTYKYLTTVPENYSPKTGQELIQRMIMVWSDGSIHHVEFSYGSGKGYDPSLYGGRWRLMASAALGLDENERLSTEELSKAVIMSEWQVKSTKLKKPGQ
jgi:hypothetical protein